MFEEADRRRSKGKKKHWQGNSELRLHEINHDGSTTRTRDTK